MKAETILTHAINHLLYGDTGRGNDALPNEGAVRILWTARREANAGHPINFFEVTQDCRYSKIPMFARVDGGNVVRGWSGDKEELGYTCDEDERVVDVPLISEDRINFEERTAFGPKYKVGDIVRFYPDEDDLTVTERATITSLDGDMYIADGEVEEGFWIDEDQIIEVLA